MITVLFCERLRQSEIYQENLRGIFKPNKNIVELEIVVHETKLMEHFDSLHQLYSYYIRCHFTKMFLRTLLQ